MSSFLVSASPLNETLTVQLDSYGSVEETVETVRSMLNKMVADSLQWKAGTVLRLTDLNNNTLELVKVVGPADDVRLFRAVCLTNDLYEESDAWLRNPRGLQRWEVV